MGSITMMKGYHNLDLHKITEQPSLVRRKGRVLLGTTKGRGNIRKVHIVRWIMCSLSPKMSLHRRRLLPAILEMQLRM